MWSKQAGDNRNIYFLKITYINLKRMMLSYVSGSGGSRQILLGGAKEGPVFNQRGTLKNGNKWYLKIINFILL